MISVEGGGGRRRKRWFYTIPLLPSVSIWRPVKDFYVTSRKSQGSELDRRMRSGGIIHTYVEG